MSFDTMSSSHLAAMFAANRGGVLATYGAESNRVLWNVGSSDPLDDIRTDTFHMVFPSTVFTTLRKNGTVIVTGKGTFTVISVDQIDDGAAKVANLSKVS